jgi:hypothetical protein
MEVQSMPPWGKRAFAQLNAQQNTVRALLEFQRANGGACAAKDCGLQVFNLRADSLGCGLCGRSGVVRASCQGEQGSSGK